MSDGPMWGNPEQMRRQSIMSIWFMVLHDDGSITGHNVTGMRDCVPRLNRVVTASALFPWLQEVYVEADTYEQAQDAARERVAQEAGR